MRRLPSLLRLYSPKFDAIRSQRAMTASSSSAPSAEILTAKTSAMALSPKQVTLHSTSPATTATSPVTSTSNKAPLTILNLTTVHTSAVIQLSTSKQPSCSTTPSLKTPLKTSAVKVLSPKKAHKTSRLKATTATLQVLLISRKAPSPTTKLMKMSPLSQDKQF